MMSRDVQDKKNEISEFFDSAPFTRWWDLKLEYLDADKSVVSMRKAVKHCTPHMMLTGGVHNYIANAAAVSLAMMRAEHFTPLKRNEMDFHRPVLLDENDIFVEATFREIRGNIILIDVVVKDGSSEKVKANGIFRYILLDRPYIPR